MDDNKRKEIEGKVVNCKLKIANEEAKLKKYETQLAVGKTAHTKKRVNQGQKQVKSTANTTETPPTDKKKEGFFEVIFS